eukprot:1934816-Prymnesium_polylepis.2
MLTARWWHATSWRDATLDAEVVGHSRPLFRSSRLSARGGAPAGSCRPVRRRGCRSFASRRLSRRRTPRGAAARAASACGLRVRGVCGCDRSSARSTSVHRVRVQPEAINAPALGGPESGARVRACHACGARAKRAVARRDAPVRRTSLCSPSFSALWERGPDDVGFVPAPAASLHFTPTSLHAVGPAIGQTLRVWRAHRHHSVWCDTCSPRGLTARASRTPTAICRSTWASNTARRPMCSMRWWRCIRRTSRGTSSESEPEPLHSARENAAGPCDASSLGAAASAARRMASCRRTHWVPPAPPCPQGVVPRAPVRRRAAACKSPRRPVDCRFEQRGRLHDLPPVRDARRTGARHGRDTGCVPANGKCQVHVKIGRYRVGPLG